jgi:hypothetical protein
VLLVLAGCPTGDDKSGTPDDETDSPVDTDARGDTDPIDTDNDPQDSDPSEAEPFCVEGCVWTSTDLMPLSTSAGVYDAGLDGSDVLHIVTLNRLPDGAVQLHTESGDGWVDEEIALWDGVALDGMGVALSFDGDVPQVAWTDRMHRFASRQGTTWSVEDHRQAESGLPYTVTMELLTGSDGRVHWLRDDDYEIYDGNLWSQGPALPGLPWTASFLADGSILLYTGVPWRLSTDVGADWTPVAVNTDGEPRVSAMAVDGMGDPRIVTSDRGDPQEDVRLWVGEQTGILIANTADGVDPRCVQLAIDGQGRNHVTWVDSGGVLQYSYDVAGDWTTIAVTDEELRDCTLLLRPSGAPVIVARETGTRTTLVVLEPTVP